MSFDQVHSQNNQSIMKLIFFGLASLVMSATVFVTVFAPIPLAMGSYIYGRAKAGVLVIFCFALAALASIYIFGEMTFLALYILVIVIAAVVSECVKRNLSPRKTIVVSGLGIVCICAASVFGYFQVKGINPRAFLVTELKQNKEVFDKQIKALSEQNSTEAIDQIAIFSQPELLADEIIRFFPSFFFMMVFFSLWANLSIVLRGRSAMNPGTLYPYSEKSLLHFKVADSVVYLLILGLLMAIWGDTLIPKWGSDIGITFIKCLGVFYFFQGFGILVKFLDHWRIFGFFRVMLIMFFVLTASWIIAIFGLFDMWVNFEKFIHKKDENSK